MIKMKAFRQRVYEMEDPLPGSTSTDPYARRLIVDLTWPDYDEADRLALLIAASPDLLMAVKSARQWISESPKLLRAGWEPLLRQLTEAIKKAEG